MRRNRPKKQIITNSDWLDSAYLLDFEKFLLSKTLLKNLPILRNWRLKRAYEKWNREP